MKRAYLFIPLFLAACATPEYALTYAGGRPAKFGGGDESQARVTLQPKGDATVQGTFFDTERRFYGEGTWRREDGRIVVDLASQPPQRLVFSTSGDQLVAREWDRSTWGEAGPAVLYRVARPTLTQ
jgi:hypothetical protein